jgi:hypothetical protein
LAADIPAHSLVKRRTWDFAMNDRIQNFGGFGLRLGIVVSAFLGPLVPQGLCEFTLFARLPAGEKKRLYEQARFTPGAKQVGFSCAFFANVPVLTIAGGIDIANGSVASKDFAASIYGLRRGDFSFMRAFNGGFLRWSSKDRNESGRCYAGFQRIRVLVWLHSG